MKRTMRVPVAVKGRVVPSSAAAKTGQDRKRRAQAIVDHIEAAKARKSGTDITDLSPDDLIADLLRHQVGV
jgi:hypothetical protein